MPSLELEILEYMTDNIEHNTVKLLKNFVIYLELTFQRIGYSEIH
jgi:hypothetical protein